ncbi:MAG TPA: pyruvate formate lyase-activating protein [Planctomycetaceae bacterium]|nr:pyruvate formate lyase-activating protein [Planctomycetaceae bacterium]
MLLRTTEKRAMDFEDLKLNTASVSALPTTVIRRCKDLPSLGDSEQCHGHVHSVETCGAVDGPGLRYVLFLSGCPLRCSYCHNPDAQGAPSGRIQTAEETIADVLRYRSFIRSGGLTISGGEPLLQSHFVQAVFRLAKQEGIHTALDTSGFLGERASDELLGDTDLVLLDIKHGVPAEYKQITGVCLEPTLNFARRLDAMRKQMWIRYVLVPGLTDTMESIRGVASFVASLQSVDRVEILPFHKMGECKYKHLGMVYSLHETPEPTPAQVARCRDIFMNHGISTK